MRVLTVIPITNNQHLGNLTYFSLKDMPLGSVVDITLRNKVISALVIQSADASDMKAILRGGDFALKRLGSTAPREVLTPAFIKAANITAAYHASTVGSIISTMVPSLILSYQDINTKIKLDPFRRHSYDAYALQTNYNDRVTIYKNTLRESLARGHSVVLVTSGPATATRLYNKLKIGIEDKSNILHSRISKSKMLKTIISISNSNKPVLLVATPKFATINIHELGTIIIEDEASTSYQTLKRPYINTTIFLREYAKKMRTKLILAGTVLSTHVHLAMRNGEITELIPLSRRQRSEVKVEIINARKDAGRLKTQDKPEKLAPFNPIDDKLKQHITKTLKAKKKILVLTPRNGLSPITICRDCNSTVSCNKCDTPVTLHQKANGDREFLCARCGISSGSDTTCTYCNSWRLESLGIGIELVEQELKKLYKKAKIIRVDKKTTKTDKAVTDAVAKFDTKGDILLTTQLSIPFIESVDTCVVISLDAMLSVPSFNIDEHVFSLLLKLKDLTKSTLLIQTRMPERSALTLAASGDISDFMRQELELRKTLKYPPYTVMVKIIATGSKRQIIDDFTKIMPRLEPYGPRVFKQFHRLSPSKFALHALLRVPTTKWPDNKLSDLLKSLQPKFEVRVNVE